MPKLKRPELAAEATRLNLEQLSRLGADLRLGRLRRRLTQAQLAERVSLTHSTVSAIERGHGGSHTLDTWQRLALAVDRPMRIELRRDAREEPADAGHLGIQELILRLGRRAGSTGSFELPTRPSDPRRSTDVALRDDRRRLLILVECWNTFGDVGASIRSTNRKLAEAADLAVAIGGERAYRVSSCWVVRDVARNRALVARYPELFTSRFGGSSASWVRALIQGGEPPAELGLVWCDARATRIFAWRRAG
ncbi:MAG: helix-turn-helix domain-containing protein [Candidatus Limnocylindrales bacterium]